MRRLLDTLALVWVCACGSDRDQVRYYPYVEARVPSPVALENLKPGTADWALSRPAAQDEVAAYASQISVIPGDAFDLHVTVSAAHAVEWELYRLGYYQGLGGRLVQSGSPVPVVPQPPCPVDSTTGLVECRWQPTFHIQTAKDWVSGYYLMKVIRDDGFDAYAPVILLERDSVAPILVQASVTTWQAYNSWGGTSLYANLLPSPQVYGNGRAFKVSFDRPLGSSTGQAATGEGARNLGANLMLRWEKPLVAWLERSGYDVGYTTNVAVHENPESLVGRRLFVTVGHDEYWSIPERNVVQNARDSGVSLAFLSANTAYWRIRLEPSSSGVPCRVIACYKGDASDPRYGQPDQTVQFRQDPYARPENSLIGVMYELYTHFDAFPFVVSNPDHWIFAGTGVSAGDSLGNLVGSEWDHVFDNGHSPRGLEVVASSEAFGVHGSVAPHNATVYYPTQRNFVFGAGSIVFSWGLGRDGYTSGHVEKIVDNLVSRAGVPRETVLEYDAAPPNVVAGSARTVASLAGDGTPGYVDGPVASARFQHPAGLAATADGTVYVADTLNHRVRAVTPDGKVTTLAGCGPNGSNYGEFQDGVGASACFNLPTGITLGPDGALYVADTGNERIRRVTLDRKVTTYAGTGDNGSSDAAPLNSTFAHPEGLAFGPDGVLYVADSENNAVRRITASGVSTVATQLQWPTGIAVGGDGTIYVVATGEARLYAISGGNVTVLANASGVFGNQDGPAAAALLRPANGIAVLGNEILFSDAANNTVRALDLTTGSISRLAGTGRAGLTLGDGAHAELSIPRGLAVVDGNVVVADSGHHRLVTITP